LRQRRASDFQGLRVFSQPQPCPQLECFLGRASFTRKRVSVTTTTAAAVIVCQSMLESDEFTHLEDDQ
jgi:prephenate dehydratase